MLSKEKMEEYKGMNSKLLMEEYESAATSKLPYAQAKAAQVAEILTRRGDFHIKNADGTINSAETQRLVTQAYGFAKKHKNKDVMDSLSKSNPIAYQKIVEQEYEEAEKEGKVIRFSDPKTGQEFRRHTETGKTLEEAQNRAFEKMTSADFENLKGQWDKEAVEKFFTSGAMTIGHLHKANTVDDHAFLQYVSEAMGDINNVRALKGKSPTFYNYLTSGKPNDFGLQIPPSVVEELEKEKTTGYYGGKKKYYDRQEEIRAGEERFDRDAGLL